MKINKIINLIIGILLFGFSMYIVFWITQTYDFTKLTIIINENENLWKFMAFLPLLVTMFVGALSIINGIISSKVMSVMSIILCGALAWFINHDLYGFVTVSSMYEEKITVLFYILIGAIVLYIIDIIISIVLKNKVKKQKANI